LTKIESNENCANSRSKIEKLKLSISEKQKELQHISKLVREVTKKTKTETEVLTKTIKGAIKIDADLTKKISNKGINYEKVLKQYQELLLTILKIQEKQSKLVEAYKEFQSSSEFNLSYEVDTSIFELELIINMEKNAKIIVQDLEKKNSDMRKIKLLFFDLENNISLCIKSMHEKDLDLDRKDVLIGPPSTIFK